MSVRSALSEPLVQFAIGGTFLFGAHRLLQDPRPQLAVVVAADATKGEVAARIDEAVLVAHARDRGLDRDDVIVRRRLAQKVRFSWEGALDPDDLDDDALTRFRDAHVERYRVPTRIAFTHAFVDPSRHDDPEATAATWREALARDGGAGVGDPFALGRTFGLATVGHHAGQFGEAFADALQQAPKGAWTVMESTLGWHVVVVDAVDGARVPEVGQIRARLRADATQTLRDDHVAAQIRHLRGQYDVNVVVAGEG